MLVTAAFLLMDAAEAVKIGPLQDIEKLEPGLAVTYLEIFVRDVSELPGPEAFESRGRVGPPIPYLGHRFESEPVFDSGLHRGVAMDITGHIRLDRPGTYLFRAISNDGIRMTLNGIALFEDPGVHADRLTPEGAFGVEQAGWYPIRIRYFQRKGTAALDLQWKPPGEPEFSTVPPEALAHAPDS